MKGSAQLLDVEGFSVRKQHVTERALIELVLPCVDQGSDDSHNTFAITYGASKPAATPSSGIESPSNKSNSRKGVKGGSPRLARRSTGSADAMPPSPSVLLAPLDLRLQFLLRLLPIVRADMESPLRNMRYMLASVVLRLLGSRVVYENASHFVDPTLIL
ncbi:unnamed protein product [Fraxinus pennsylvanica]|uniref:Uncharacterized protein n=1 Tax=Fraxinus pennsylvanica TaxID=56036 RepID=A0AAD2A509_9LAMI|nr:unnamed protein product [Fraxinus pennsylvanica]